MNYVTFCIGAQRFAVECENDEKRKEVARDAYSLDGVSNIGFRKSKPCGNIKVLSYSEYFDFKKWY